MDWKKIVGTVAPTIATALGGPLAGIATKAIAGAFGMSDDSDDDAVAAAVANATPEQLLELKRAEQGFVLRMRELDIDLERLALDDRKDARARAVAMNDRSPIWIGAMVLTVWAVVNFTLLITPYPPVIAGELVGRILGMIDAATMAFLYWLYGSSAGSKTKDETIKQAVGR